MNGKAGNTLDLAAFGVVGLAWMDWLPTIAAVLSIIWLLMRIFDWIYVRFKPKKD